MDDPNILDLDFQILGQIEMILENKSTRESFLKVVPPEFFSNTTIQLMDNETYKYHMTTARWLLFQFGKKDVRVAQFAQWLEEANLEKALVLLKKDVPLKITEQPPQFLCLRKGSKLSVSCKASSYPPPEYQWFKGDQELLLQQESQLIIEYLKEEDSDIYVCLVSKHNLETNDFSYIYSHPLQVDVTEEKFGPTTFSEFGQNLVSLNKSIIASSNYCPISSEACDISERISIIKQPYVSGKVSQGMSVCLHCTAASGYPVEYQWYRNGRILNGSNSPKLHLNDLYPDPQTGDMKWEYFCEVSNTFDKQFSQTVIVELEISNDTTPYYASAKYAFMVANDQYDNFEELKKPAFDVADLGELLMSIKFNVFAYRNLTLSEMKNAFNTFCEHIIPNSYVLFYFAGHGFEQYGQMYLKPVECSSNYNPQECMCTEDILQQMQETNPALNILLIDACRNLPPALRNGLNLVVPPGEIFEAKMKNNTLYGYSTPFLYSSHESDSERNSFFVKYLKKYITYNKNIEDILRLVRIDFEGDPMIKGVQFPVMKTSLCGNRKLCDEIIGNDLKNEGLIYLDDIKGKFVTWEYELPRVKSVFTLKVSPFFNIFMNEIEITVFLYIEEQAPFVILKDLEVNLIFEIPGIQVQPMTGIALKTIDLKINKQNVVLTKQILGLQKMKIKELNGKLMLKFFYLKVLQEREFLINIEKIIFTNYLG